MHAHHVARLIDGGKRLDPQNLEALCEQHHNALGGAGGRL